MPAVDAPRGGNKYAKPTPPPKPPAPPPPSRVTSSVPHGSGVISVGRAAPPRPASAYTAPPPKQVVPDATPHGRGTLTKVTPGSTQPQSAYANPQSYAKTVLQVFKAQPVAQQRAVIQGAVKNPGTAESKILLQYVRAQNPAGVRGAAAIYNPVAAVGGIGHNVAPIVGNALKDAYNLPAGTVEGLYGLAKQGATGFSDLTSGNLAGAAKAYGGAAHMLADPYIQAAEHPISTFTQHPLNTLLLAAGPKALVGRGLGGLARGGALGETAAKAASTVREPLSVGTIAGEPSPIVEARDYSPDVINKAFQVAREKAIRAKGQNPNVSRPVSALPGPMAYAMNAGTRAKLFRKTDEMTAVHQMEQRGTRNIATQALQKERPSPAARNVVAHALQGILRTPESAPADAAAEIARLKAAQPGLQRRSVELAQNRAQVRDLSNAVTTPGALDEAMRAAESIRPFINSQDATLQAHGFLDPEQAMRSKLFPYAQAHMGATYDHVGGRLVKADGTTLPTQEVLNHLSDNGVSDPAFVAHLPGKIGAGHFYKAYRMARGALSGGTRTGKAFAQGSYDHTWNGLIGQVANRAQTLSRAALHDRVISRFGVRIPQDVTDKLGIKSPNGDFTPDEARRVARAAQVDDHGNPIPNALELVPVARAPKGVLDSIRDLQSPHELHNVSQLELKALADSIRETARRTDGTRNVVLVPKDVVDRFAQQYARTDTLLKSVGRVTQQFRRTVLPYSTHWMLQIGSEAGLRAILGGALHPDYLRAGRALTHYLEQTPEGRAANAEMTNATFYSGGGSGVREAAMGRAGRGNLDIHNPNAGRVASAARAFSPTRVLVAAHNRYADTITAAMYGLEHNARLMGLGKLAHREVQSFGHSWSNTVRLQGKAIADLGEKLKADPALTAKFGREIDNIFGKYSKFTPAQRAMIQSFTPFLPWYLNAAKYVLWHLPAHHPVATSLLASLRQTVNQDVADGKQLPLNVWAMQELARISPFGIFTPPSTKPSTGGALEGQHVLDAFLPQAQGSLYNLAGINSFGAGPLKGPKGSVKAKSGPAAAAAAENLLEAFLPLARYVKTAEQGGKSSFGTSSVLSPQVKPGQGQPNAGSVLGRIFNPFYSVQSAQGNAKAPVYGAPSGSSGGGYVLGSGGQSGGSGGYVLGSGGQSSSGGGYVLGSGG